MNRIIPFKRKDGDYDLFVVFSPVTLKRLVEYDPCMIETRKLGHPWNTLKVRDIHLLYATEAELAKFDKCKSAQEVLALIKVLGRGWKFRPELGDNDAPYMSKDLHIN